MKRVLLALVALFFVGCASKVSLTSHERVVLSDLDRSMIQSLKSRVNQNGVLEVELVLYSASDKDLDYKVVWYDAEGFILQDPLSSSYQRARINKRQALVMKKVAFDQRARDYKIFINGISLKSKSSKGGR